MPGHVAHALGYNDDTDNERLAMMSHADLFMAREAAGADQKRLAPYEHRAFAREFAAESPMKAAASLPFAIPGYTAAKAVGSAGGLAGRVADATLGRNRTPPSMEEMKQGFIGLGEGLKKRLKR